MPFISSNGDISYGSENDDFVMNTVIPLVNKVNEITEIWEKAQATPFNGVSSFRLLAEYNNIVLAGRDDTEKGYGLHFVTWQCDKDRTFVELGHYMEDYNAAKQDFAIRSGLIPQEKVFTPEQAAEIKAAVEYRLKNDDDITLKTEDRLTEISANLKFAYPEKDVHIKKDACEKDLDLKEQSHKPSILAQVKEQPKPQKQSTAKKRMI